jgi:hypothetical protein
MALWKPFSSSNTHAPEGPRETDHQQAALLGQAGGATLLNELAFRRGQADNWTGGWRNSLPIRPSATSPAPLRSSNARSSASVSNGL